MRVVVAVVASLFLLVVASCGVRPGVELAARSSCTHVRAGTTTTSDETVVVAVSARDCHAADGALLPVGESVERLAAAVWSEPWPRFEAVHVTVHRSVEAPDGAGSLGAVLHRSVLEERWGVRPAGLDRTNGGLSLGDLLPLLLVPLAAMIHLGLVAALVRTVRSGGVVVVWFRR